MLARLSWMGALKQNSRNSPKVRNNTTMRLFFYVLILTELSTAWSFKLKKFETVRTVKTCLKSTAVEADVKLAADIVEASSRSQKLQFDNIFGALAANHHFMHEIWQKKPLLIKTPLPSVYGAYTMTDVKEAVDNDFLEAGRGTTADGKGGWKIAEVSRPRGTSFQDAKLQYEDIQMAMKEKSGTVVFNSAGGFIPKLANVCLDAVQATSLPCALNMYLTAAGQQTSAPPHTDKQDVFVFQCQGYKRWRVFSPPPPSRMPRADPFARGKTFDTLEMSELDAPLIDTVLGPGDFIYCPGGFPHTTDTIHGIPEDNTEPSVHLTIGLDTHIWGLNYASLRSYALQHAGLEDKLLLTKLDPKVYWSLQDTIPVGFLALEVVEPVKGFGSAMRAAQRDAAVKGLLQRMRAAEPTRWPEDTVSDEDLAKAIHAEEVVTRLLQHHEEITEIFSKLYADVAFKISPVKMDLSLFRSQPYFQLLEQTMEKLVAWAKPPKVSKTAAVASELKKDKSVSSGFDKLKKSKQAGGFGNKL